MLRAFGAQLGKGVCIHPTAAIWAPWNLSMGQHSCLGPHVDCYSVALIEIGEYVVVSQYAYLCSATHDYTKRSMPLVSKPIRIGASAWIAAGAFIGPGIHIGEGSVVGARACVTRDVNSWAVVVGNPAVEIKRRMVVEE